MSRGYWLVSSYNYENLEIVRKRLLWGFWGKNSASKSELLHKLRKNWREFISLYNKIKPGDLVFFQSKNSYVIHGFGVVSGKYFDDQTPIWPLELNKRRVFFPWRVTFCVVVLTRDGFHIHAVKKSSYIDGYGLGVLTEHEAYRILDSINDELGNRLVISF